jgi:hypothetical protein
MGATLNLGMRDVNWSKDPIWVEYETDLIAAAVCQDTQKWRLPD